MSIKIKTPEEIEKMRVAGQLAADVLIMIAPHVKAGVTTDELNTLCHDYIVNVQQAIPAPLNYHGFPKSICTSVNDVICHGIPNHKKLREGDIINLDITVIKDGYHGDTSAMFIVGQTTPLRRQLCKVAQESLYAAIQREGSLSAAAHALDLAAPAASKRLAALEQRVGEHLVVPGRHVPAISDEHVLSPLCVSAIVGADLKTESRPVRAAHQYTVPI